MIFSYKDLANIKEAIRQGGKIWDSTLLKDPKTKIKNFLLTKQGQRCCYCQRPLVGEFRMVIDIEHILPKSKYERYMFNITNLAVACKRCNMSIKRDDTSFFKGTHNNPATHFNSDSYKFIHPNLDDYFLHLDYLVKIVNGKMMIKYNLKNNSSKGQYTYDYFKLIELEVNSFNEAQGIEVDTPNQELIDSDSTQEIEDLLNMCG